MNLAIYIAIAGVIVALGSFLLTYFGFITKILISIGDIKQEIGKVSSIDPEKIYGRLNNIEVRLGTVNVLDMVTSVAAMRVEMNMFWGHIDPILNELIKQPIHLRKDELLDRFNTLSVTELTELKGILETEVKDLKSKKDLKALVYGLKLAQIDIKLHEQ